MTEEKLYLLYEEYNRLYFANKLPPTKDVILAYSGRLTAAAGICYPSKRIIRLSTHYHTKYPEEVGSTLLHEMIHLLVFRHGKEFKAWVRYIRKLGGFVELHARERATEAVYHWYYRCTACGHVYPRKKRMPKAGRNYRCGHCRGLLEEHGGIWHNSK